MEYAKWAAKAIFASVVAGIGTAIVAAPDGFTLVEWLTIASSALVAGGGVFGITNGPDPRPEAP